MYINVVPVFLGSKRIGLQDSTTVEREGEGFGRRKGRVFQRVRAAR